MGGRFCGWVDVLIPALGVLPGYRNWTLQDPYLPLLGVSARVTPLDSGLLPIPGLWHVLEIALHMHIPSLSPDLLTYDSHTMILFSYYPFFYSVLSFYQHPISILCPLLKNIQLPSLGPSLLFDFYVSVDYSMVFLYFIANIHL